MAPLASENPLVARMQIVSRAEWNRRGKDPLGAAATWFGFELQTDTGRELFSSYRAATQAEAIARLLERGDVARYRLAEVGGRPVEGFWAEVER